MGSDAPLGRTGSVMTVKISAPSNSYQRLVGAATHSRAVSRASWLRVQSGVRSPVLSPLRVPLREVTIGERCGDPFPLRESQMSILILAPPLGASRAEIEPPWASATWRAKLKPTPLPPLWVV